MAPTDTGVACPPAPRAAMPQTLLAIAAIAAAGLLTLSQGRSVHATTESVMRDQFELTVAGTLLHTMEFADARSFDEATTPEKLRARYGLPEEMTRADRDTITYDDLQDIAVLDFAEASSFGGVVCNVEEPWQSIDCDDLDDIDAGAWQEVVFETSDAAPLSVEVRATVDYVEADAPDVPVSHRTFHKRIEVQARTTDLKSASGEDRPIEVALRRVISFDPAVAAEYLRRSIRVIDGEACVNEEWETQLGLLQAALTAAQEAQVSASASLTLAQDGLATAQATATATAAAKDAAYDDLVDQYYASTVVWEGVRYWRSASHRDLFYAVRDDYYAARDAADAAAAAVGPAEQLVTTAEAAASVASQRVAEAEASLLGHTAAGPTCP